MEYHEAGASEIFDPLEMNRTAFDVPSILFDGISKWEEWRRGDYTSSYDSPASWSAGFAWSTANDLAAFGHRF